MDDPERRYNAETISWASKTHVSGPIPVCSNILLWCDFMAVRYKLLTRFHPFGTGSLAEWDISLLDRIVNWRVVTWLNLPKKNNY